MNATDVYNVAKALPKEELTKLYGMLRNDINKPTLKVRKKSKLPDFTFEDGLKFFLENRLKKSKPI